MTRQAERPRPRQVATYADAISAIQQLRANGYVRTGQWSLGQICAHLNYYLRGSLEGFSFQLPWLLRKLVGGPLLKKWLKSGVMPTGGRTVPASLPPPEVDDDAAIAETLELLRQLCNRTESLHPSPLFGELDLDTWRRLHLLHIGHHLGFLTPRE